MCAGPAGRSSVASPNPRGKDRGAGPGGRRPRPGPRAVQGRQSHTRGQEVSGCYGGCSELSSSRESEGPLVMGASRTGSLTSESQRFLCENGRTAAYYCFFTCMEPSHRQSDNHADRQQEPCLMWDRLWPHGRILLLEFVLRIT